MPKAVDVAIIGGGIMGVSTAYWLNAMEPGLEIVVFERDPSHARSSTALSVASIRQQFTQPINVRISRFGLDFIRRFPETTAPVGGIDLGFRGNGYLFLAGTPEAAAGMRRSVAMQRREGAATELLEPAALAERFDWLDPSGLCLASYGGTEEGWFDNMGLWGGLRDMARLGGVQFAKAEVAGLEAEGRAVGALLLADGGRVAAGEIVNATGTRASALLRLLGEDLPIESRKRTVFVVDAPGAQHPEAPLIVDHLGYYARPEGSHWIMACVPEEDPAVGYDDFTERHWEFEEVIWPRIAQRIPNFDRARVLRRWVGHYAYNRLDQNAILGRHPIWRNLLLINGFSGHGLQQAPAMGRGLAELILHGAFRSLDLTPFAVERIVENRPFRECAIV